MKTLKPMTFIAFLASLAVVGGVAHAQLGGNDNEAQTLAASQANGPTLAAKDGLAQMSSIKEASLETAPESDYGRIEHILPATARDEDELTRADLPGQSEAKVLYDDGNGNRISAIAVRDQVCLAATGDGVAAATGCTSYLGENGINPLYADSKTGVDVFALVRDDVVAVNYTDSDGTQKTARVQNNAVAWSWSGRDFDKSLTIHYKDGSTKAEPSLYSREK